MDKCIKKSDGPTFNELRKPLDGSSIIVSASKISHEISYLKNLRKYEE